MPPYLPLLRNNTQTSSESPLRPEFLENPEFRDKCLKRTEIVPKFWTLLKSLVYTPNLNKFDFKIMHNVPLSLNICL